MSHAPTPERARAGAKAARSCSGRRRFAAHVRLPRGAHVRRVRATLNGRRVASVRRVGRSMRVPVDLRRLTKGVATLRVTVTLRGGRTVSARRVYHPCTRRG